MSKPPTPQAISALLRKAGFIRSEDCAPETPGGIRGWTAGYEARRPWHSDDVVVRSLTGSRPEPGAPSAREMLALYAKAIRDSGWTVSESPWWDSPELIVTAPEESR